MNTTGLGDAKPVTGGSQEAGGSGLPHGSPVDQKEPPRSHPAVRFTWKGGTIPARGKWVIHLRDRSLVAINGVITFNGEPPEHVARALSLEGFDRLAYSTPE